MSTRATYQFHHNDTFKADTTIYIHSDGYPEGAAHYIYHALRAAEVSELLKLKNEYFTVEDFIRNNLKAEITGHHLTHKDTEFKSEFRNCVGNGLFSLRSSVTVYSRAYGEKWKQESHSTIEEFLLQFPKIEQSLRAFCGYDKEKPITQFKPGQKYYFRFTTDYDLICKYEVVRRSEKSVWLTPIEHGDGHQGLGEVSRFVINVYNSTENVMPLGRYSMAPSLRADNLVANLKQN